MEGGIDIGAATAKIEATYAALTEYQTAITQVQLENGAQYEATKDAKDKAKQL